MSRNERDIQERRLARDIRSALDASADAVPADIAERLAAGRRIALARKKAEAPVRVPQFATQGAYRCPTWTTIPRCTVPVPGCASWRWYGC